MNLPFSRNDGRLDSFQIEEGATVNFWLVKDSWSDLELLWGSCKATFLSHAPFYHQLSCSEADPGKKPLITFSYAHAISQLGRWDVNLPLFWEEGEPKTSQDAISVDIFCLSPPCSSCLLLMLQLTAEDLAVLVKTSRLECDGGSKAVTIIKNSSSR